MKYTEFKSKNNLNKILREEFNIYDKSPDKNVLYEKGFCIQGRSFNYLNSKSSNLSEKAFRPLIKREFEKLESIYPTAGDVFLDYVMKNIKNFNSESSIKKIIDDCDKEIEFIKNNSKSIHKKDFVQFLKNEINNENKDLIETLFDNVSIDTKIYIEKSFVKETVIEKKSGYTFELVFDQDFLLNKESWTAKDYNFVIVDGFIQTVGEIYHLLTQANENKEPYVIFCKGIDPEVKSVLIQNLMRGTVDIIPVSLEINELNVNILSDIAMCHDSDVISSLKGETISMATRRKLNRGKKIKVGKGFINISPVVDKERIEKHRKYLITRRSNTELKIGKDIIDQRIKMLNPDKIILRLNKKHMNDLKFLNDLKKMSYFLKNGSSGIVVTEGRKLFSQKSKLMPSLAAYKSIKTIQSFCKIIYNTHGAVIIE